ncbi:MAG TPA: membrane protein insertase YidC [Longimicrobium sp.]|nr:membrane protein insertase YidC [Longimicrobium sp.]
MEKRLALAFMITAVLLIVWQTFFPPIPPQPARPRVENVAPAAAPAAAAAPGTAPAAAPATALPPAQTVAVRSPLYEYRFSTRGAALTGAELLGYPSYVQRNGHVQLVPRGATDVLSGSAVSAARTVDLRTVQFTPSAPRLDVRAGGPAQTLTFTGTQNGAPVAEIVYTFHPDNFAVDVRGRLLGMGGAATLYTSLGTGLAPHDAKEHGTSQELAFVGWNGRRVEREYLKDTEAADTIAGPLSWAGIKDRYFLMALLPQKTAFTRLVATDRGDERYSVGGEAMVSPRAAGVVAMPVGADGTFAYRAYLGPLEHERLVAMGSQLEEVNPYGYRWLRPVVRPIAAVVLWSLRELHDNLGLAYGWVLVVFGVLVRLVTWPLNARAMRSQMKNMAVQPVLQERMKELQKKYADDPRRQQQEMMKMYQELGVNPFSMMSGCLPMLIPMPVLITLFFVFQGAIEFRGASFAWLPDLSLRDPLYLLPVLLVVSMFALQWISTKMSGMPDNPQTKMMLYTMPLMMGIFFWLMPSGLNLYYVSSNIASLPQQLMIARERRVATQEQKVKDAVKPKRSGTAKPSRR